MMRNSTNAFDGTEYQCKKTQHKQKHQSSLGVNMLEIWSFFSHSEL